MLATVLVAAGLLAGCGSDDEQDSESTPVASSVEEQLKYLDPKSSAVFTVDMRYEGRNWEHLRDVISRGLSAYRDAGGPGAAQLPTDPDAALDMLTSFVGVSFEEDVKPLLDGYAVIGVTFAPGKDEPVTVVTYRTGGDGLEDVLTKLNDGEGPKPLEGYDDVQMIDDLALVGGDTLVFAETEGGADDPVAARAAVDRAKEDAGFPANRLTDAQKAAGLDDPFVLMTGDTTIARAWVREESYQRALDEVPWLGAIRSLAGAVRLDERGADLAGTVSTDPRALSDDDLPLAPAGELELPRNELITGASRDQSVTTTFLSRTVRALFADSDFAKAVERAEKDLGAKFEDEVLRQFNCPSMSQLQPGARRFGAKSCVSDPERMRELLPKLSQHLPRILTAMQRLDSQGLAGLLLIAPDAPLTPSFTQLAQIVVKPFEGAEPEETLYRITGLGDDASSEFDTELPEQVVFGLIGDVFVVGSDVEMARQAAKLEGEALDEPAASAIRIPATQLITGAEGDEAPEEEAVAKTLGEILMTASADRASLKAKGRLELSE